MTIDPGPHDLTKRRAILSPDCSMVLKDDGPGFYEALGDFKGKTLISQFDFDEPWPTWEVHPKGDELVYLISGATVFRLWKDGEEQRLEVNRPGHYVVVPKGWWHTAEPLEPTSLFFVTPGEGTINEEVPPGMAG